MYINESLDIYPRFDGDIQLVQPGWTPDMPLPEGWEKVLTTEMPVPEIGQITEELHPEKIDGTWFQKWNIRNMTEQELENIRLTNEEIKKSFGINN